MSRKVINIISPFFATAMLDENCRMETAARTLSTSFCVNVFAITTNEKNKNYSVKINEHLTIHFIHSRSFFKAGFFLRNLSRFYQSARLLDISNSFDSDLTIVSCRGFFITLLFAMKCNSKKMIADIPDFSGHFLSASSWMKKFFRKRITTNLLHALHRFDAITVSNDSEKNALMDYGFIEESKITSVMNGISHEKHKQLSELKYMPHQNQFIISYVGEVNECENLYTLIDSVDGMNEVRLNIIGDGTELKNLQKYISEKNISNVFTPGKLRWNRILPYYQTSNLLFLNLNCSSLTSFPSGLFENISTGLPILYHGTKTAGNLLKKFSNTFFLAHDDVKEFERMIWRIRRLSPARSKTNSLIAGKYFIREKLSILFAELSARLLNETALSDVFVEDILIGLEH